MGKEKRELRLLKMKRREKRESENGGKRKGSRSIKLQNGKKEKWVSIQSG